MPAGPLPQAGASTSIRMCRASSIKPTPIATLPRSLMRLRPPARCCFQREMTEALMHRTIVASVLCTLVVAAPARADRPVTDAERVRLEAAVQAQGCSGGKMEFDETIGSSRSTMRSVTMAANMISNSMPSSSFSGKTWTEAAAHLCLLFCDACRFNIAGRRERQPRASSPPSADPPVRPSARRVNFGTRMQPTEWFRWPCCSGGER